jgi:hypothetical protein
MNLIERETCSRRKKKKKAKIRICRPGVLGRTKLLMLSKKHLYFSKNFSIDRQ